MALLMAVIDPLHLVSQKLSSGASLKIKQQSCSGINKALLLTYAQPHARMPLTPASKFVSACAGPCWRYKAI